MKNVHLAAFFYGFFSLVLVRAHACGGFNNGDTTNAFVTADGKLIDIQLNRIQARSEVWRLNKDGTLDSSFNNQGYLRFTYTEDFATQPDGKLLFVFNQGVRLSIVRFNANGSVDKRFGAGGVVSIDSKYYAECLCLRVRQDGKLLLAYNERVTDPFYTTNLVGLMPNGTVDQTFGDNGLAKSDGFVHAILVQPDKKILSLQIRDTVQGARVYYMTRFDKTGHLDLSFGQAGKMPMPKELPPDSGVIEHFLVRPDGKIFTAYLTGKGFFSTLVFNSDGSADPMFGKNGQLTVPSTNGFSGPIFDAKSRMLNHKSNFGDPLVSLQRLLPNGEPDKSFGIDGTVFTSGGTQSPAQFFSHNLAVDNEESVFLTGIASVDDPILGNQRWRIVEKYMENGELDTAFGELGRVKIPLY